MKAWALVLFAFLATPAWAGWQPCESTATDTGTATAKLAPGKDTCLRQSTATDPAFVDARNCRGGVDLLFNSDTAGANYDATLKVYQCTATGTAGTFTGCERINVTGVATDMTGNPTGNLEAISGIWSTWIAFDVTNGSSRAIDIRLICK